MNFKSSTLVWDTSKHSGGALLVLLRLAWHSDDDGYSFPSIELIATKCRMTARNVIYILDALIASGEVTKEKRGRHNIYRVILGNVQQVNPASQVKPASPIRYVKQASEIGEAGFTSDMKPASPQPALNRQKPFNTEDQDTHTARATSTAAERVCVALKRLEISGLNAGHPKFLALIADGATEAEFVGAAQAAIEKGKGFAYSLGMLKNMRIESANGASAMPKGPMPIGGHRQSATDRRIETYNGLTGKGRNHGSPNADDDIIDVDARTVG